MTNRYIVFDVETPNAANNRMSAIGITVVQDGGIAEEFYSLVNPEAGFDSFNIQLTGITPEMVADHPTFPELWRQIQPLMDSGTLVAHYAVFDMGVLEKCLRTYGIAWKPCVGYACTCVMGRVSYPRLINHKLDTLCAHAGIELNHHHAGSDSRATAGLLIDYIRRGLDVDRFTGRYNLIGGDVAKPMHHTQPSESSKQLIMLKELINTLTADGELNEQEILLLHNWMSHNLSLRGNYPFDKIFWVVENALEDGFLGSDELHMMMQLFEQALDPVAAACECVDFNILGKTFCLTGEFDFGDRPHVQMKLSQMGGIPVNSVSSKTDYLIVGNQGSEAWSSGNYGTKVKKAMELQEKGSAIQIVKEREITDHLTN